MWSVFAVILASTIAVANASDCSKTRILFLTDSHGLGPFGDAIDEPLRAIPDARIDVYNFGGSSPYTWYRGIGTKWAYEDHTTTNAKPKPRSRAHAMTPEYFPDLLVSPAAAGASGFCSSYAIINLGSNFGFTGSNDDALIRETKRMLKDIYRTRTSCTWISPPNMPKFDRPGTSRTVDHLYEVHRLCIEEAAAEVEKEHPELAPIPRCHLIDSRPISHYPVNPVPKCGDGVHYAFGKLCEKAGRAWGEAAWSQIRTFIPEALSPEERLRACAEKNGNDSPECREH